MSADGAATLSISHAAKQKSATRTAAQTLARPNFPAIGPHRKVAGQRSNVPDVYLYIACTRARLCWVLAALPGGRAVAAGFPIPPKPIFRVRVKKGPENRISLVGG
jgi:hypothetical protein